MPAPQERKRRRLLKAAGKLDCEDLTWLLARRVATEGLRECLCCIDFFHSAGS